MGKLTTFNLITLDGYFAGKNSDISWHNFGPDEQEMSDKLSNEDSTLVFGRITYEMMAAYWSSADALKNDSVTAQGMNEAKKIVFSRSMKKASWQNTQLISANPVEELKRRKTQGEQMTILGSGQIVAQCAAAGVIDEYSLLLNPLAIGAGKSLFEGLGKTLKLKLAGTRAMKSGNVLLTYYPE